MRLQGVWAFTLCCIGSIVAGRMEREAAGEGREWWWAARHTAFIATGKQGLQMKKKKKKKIVSDK